MAQTDTPPTPPTTASTTAPDAPAGAPTTAGASPDFMQFLPLIAIFAVFYFLIIRPQQARMKEHKASMNALKQGDRIVTGGGIIGTIVHAPDGAAEISVDLNDTTRVSVLRSTISHVIKPEAAANDDAAKKKSA
jgi:preprotein translocase subunit YajC